MPRWTSERDRVYNQIMERGWNPQTRAFTQHYTTEVLDSSLLMMPLQGFVAPRDPMWISTLEAMDRELVSDSLVYRYNPGASPDGLAGDEGTFSLAHRSRPWSRVARAECLRDLLDVLGLGRTHGLPVFSMRGRDTRIRRRHERRRPAGARGSVRR